MNALSLAPMARLASLAPLAVRVIVRIIMVAHGLQKLTGRRTSVKALRGWAYPYRCLWLT